MSTRRATRVRLIGGAGAIASVNQTTLWLPRISLPTRTLETGGFPNLPMCHYYKGHSINHDFKLIQF
ncbi:MAG: hypothetical protein ACYT04_25565 [Nostoc sp.]